MEIPEREHEAIMRMTMCARRNCRICKYGQSRKRPTVKLPQSCLDRITENMNILAAMANQTEKEILYICDRTLCENCHEECRHTTRIDHAVNFEKIEGYIWEKENHDRD